MQRHYGKGISITEYGLAIGLVVIIAIPALQLMGENLSTHYTNLGDPGQFNGLMGLIASPVGNSPAASTNVPSVNPSGASAPQMPLNGTLPVNSTPPPVAATQSSSPVPNSVQAVWNPDTNQIEFTIFDGQGAGTNASSVEGTKLLAMQMQHLVENFTFPDGSKPASDDPVIHQMLDLVDDGFKTADGEDLMLGGSGGEFGLINQNPGLAAMLGYQPASNEDIMANRYLDFHQQYEKLHQIAANHGDKYDTLLNDTEPLVGMIQKIAAENFMIDLLEKNGGSMVVTEDPYRPQRSKWTKTLTLDNYQSFHVGADVSVENVSIQISPDVTRIASQTLLNQSGQNGSPLR